MFNNGVILLAITTFSGKQNPPHTGMIYHEFLNPSGTTKFIGIRPSNGPVFRILNEKTIYNQFSIPALGSIYTLPAACSIASKIHNITKSKPAAPPNPVELLITIYYIDIPVVNSSG